MKIILSTGSQSDLVSLSDVLSGTDLLLQSFRPYVSTSCAVSLLLLGLMVHTCVQRARSRTMSMPRKLCASPRSYGSSFDVSSSFTQSTSALLRATMRMSSQFTSIKTLPESLPRKSKPGSAADGWNPILVGSSVSLMCQALGA